MDGRGPYGLACKVCYKAKAKCVKRKDGPGCHRYVSLRLPFCDASHLHRICRCWRLGKDCVPSDSIRRRTMAEYQLTQYENLEGRLNELTILIQGMRHGAIPAMQLPLHQHLQELQQLQVPMSMMSMQPHPPPPPPDAVLPSSTLETPPAPASEPPESPPAESPAHEMAVEVPALPTRDHEAALASFRDHMLQFFPILYLPPWLSAEALKQNRPVLFEAILAVTSRSVDEKRNRGKAFKQMIAHEVVVENRSSLDMLLGLLTYTAWSNDQHLETKTTLPRLMDIALTIVHALRMDKAEAAGSHAFYEFGGKDVWAKPTDVTTEHHEGKRAVIGCFLLASFVSIYFAMSVPMPWTRQMEGFLRAVEDSPEWAGDTLLAAHVRVQMVAHNVKVAREESDSELSIPFITKTFITQLDKLQQTLPQAALDNNLLIGHVHYVELTVYETAFTAKLSPGVDDGTQTPLGTDPNDCMWHSLLAIRAWMERYERVEPDDHVGFTITFWAQLSCCLVTLYRLTVHPAIDWDREAARTTIDVVETITFICKQVDKVKPPTNEIMPDDFWTRLNRMSKAILSWIYMTVGGRQPQAVPDAEGEEDDTGAPAAQTATQNASQTAPQGASHNTSQDASQAPPQPAPQLGPQGPPHSAPQAPQAPPQPEPEDTVMMQVTPWEPTDGAITLSGPAWGAPPHMYQQPPQYNLPPPQPNWYHTAQYQAMHPHGGAHY
ncbi:uncharacterized protein BDV14DRAFT_129676 [Aspergillus stella-maris]|uniref:uncharacterized protein n=1 Tax=Aspergillus stella-maris TaxID=1810926 RepID=UPI003CCD3921